VFVRLKNGEELYEARLVRLASRAITVWLNPFRVLFAERVVNLVLKLNVRANFVGAARRTVHFHCPRYRQSKDLSYKASGGFCGATCEVVAAPSFERDDCVSGQNPRAVLIHSMLKAITLSQRSLGRLFR